MTPPCYSSAYTTLFLSFLNFILIIDDTVSNSVFSKKKTFAFFLVCLVCLLLLHFSPSFYFVLLFFFQVLKFKTYLIIFISYFFSTINSPGNTFLSTVQSQCKLQVLKYSPVFLWLLSSILNFSLTHWFLEKIKNFPDLWDSSFTHFCHVTALLSDSVVCETPICTDVLCAWKGHVCPTRWEHRSPPAPGSSSTLVRLRSSVPFRLFCLISQVLCEAYKNLPLSGWIWLFLLIAVPNFVHIHLDYFIRARVCGF